MTKTRYALLPLILCLTACSPPASDHQAAGDKSATATNNPPPTASAATGDEAAARSSIKAAIPGLDDNHIRQSPMAGVYEVQIGMNFGYVTADGRYLIAGDLTDLKDRREITEDARRAARVALVERMDKAGFIEFAPKNPKYTVTVFTDVDCGYCQMLHRQIQAYNDEGIAVRYLFFPRTGLNTPSFYKAEEVWCSKDRNDALTKAKSGVDLHGDKTCPNPVAEHLQAAADLGLRGTPSIVLPSGDLIPGYQPPPELLRSLETKAAAKTEKTNPAG